MKLVYLEGKDKDQVWELTFTKTIIGRDSSCDIVVDDSELSRIHAEIVHEGNAFIFYEKDSMNGSFINGYQVTRQILIPGDQIRIGNTKIQVLEDDLTKNINWQETDSIITSKVTLNQLSDQIEEVTSSLAIAQKIPKTSIRKKSFMEKIVKNLKTVYEVGNAINSISTLDKLLNQVAETLLDVFPEVQRVCILLKEKGEDFDPKFIKNRADVPSHLFQISRSVINKSVEEKVSILAKDAFHDNRFSSSKSIIAINLRSFMCAPLVNKGIVLGLIYLDNCDKPDCFDNDDLELLSALANQSAIALENSRLYEDIQKAYHEAILALMNTVEAKDPYTRGHSQRISRYALGIAQEMELKEEECKEIKIAAELHDIGKIGIRERIIDKESTLSQTEFHSMQEHVLIGENIVKPIEYLSFILPMVRGHHEKYNGSGYPDSLKADEIPLGARILAVADAFDAMTTQRPYNKPLTFKKALKKCESLKGKQFDSDAVDALAHYITHNINSKTDETFKG